MHATVMIFFVIIPWLTGAFGNFLIPLHDRRTRHGVPEAQHDVATGSCGPPSSSSSLSFFVEGGAAGIGWTSYPTLSSAAMPAGSGIGSPAAPTAGTGPDPLAAVAALRRHLVDDGLGQLHHDHHQHARPGMTLFRMPMTDLGHVHHRHPAGVRPARPDRRPDPAAARQDHRHHVLPARPRPGVRQLAHRPRRRPAAALAAPVLVLLAPRRLHHDPAGDGHGLRHHLHLRPQAALRLPADGLRHRRHRGPRASSSGATTCSSAA